jgi:hypothetical protein
MLGADAHRPQWESPGAPAGNFGLTNSVAALICRGNDDIDSQGNYDYHAHAQVLPGGADPLGSQGYAGAVRHPSALKRGPRSQKLAGVFILGDSVFGKAGPKDLLRNK